MKNPRVCLAIVSCFVFGVSLAQAESETRHEPMQVQMAGQSAEMMFKSMDVNGDGAVSRAEFDAFYGKRFQELDANNDGKITPDEMKRGQEIPTPDMKNNGTTHLDERFNAADANHDGGLDRGEAKDMPMLSMYFDEVDSNHDGKVTRQEYFDAMPLLHRAKQGKADSL